jgi:hypothetical protein
MNGGGDVLAKGGKSATFGPPKVSQERWNAIWAEEPKEPKPKSKKQSEK